MCIFCDAFCSNILFIAGSSRKCCRGKRLQWGSWQGKREAKLYHRGSPRGGVWGPVWVWGPKLWWGQGQSAYKALLRRQLRVSFKSVRENKVLIVVCVQCTFSQSVWPSGYLGSRKIINYPRPTQQKPPFLPLHKAFFTQLFLLTHPISPEKHQFACG